MKTWNPIGGFTSCDSLQFCIPVMD